MSSKMLIAVCVTALVTGLAASEVKSASPQPRQNASASVSDKYTIRYVKANLTEGKTTKQQVEAKFGEPADRNISSDSETWIYRREKEGARGQIQKAGKVLGRLKWLLPGAAGSVAGEGYSKAEDSGSAMRVYDELTVDGKNSFSQIYIVFDNNIVSYYSVSN